MNLQNREFFFVSLLLYSFGSSIYAQSKLKLLEFPKFPISANKEFLIRIVSTKQSININRNVLDALVFEISDNKMKEKAIINYGFKNIENTFQGQNFIIRNWRKLDDLEMIVVNISFNKIANNKILNIYHISPLTNENRQDLLKRLSDEKPIFSSLVSLSIPPKLDLFIRSADGSIGELALNKIGFAVCRAYEGEPFVRPMWINLYDFNVKYTYYKSGKNEIELQFNVSIDNHLQEIHCKAGESSTSAKMFVLHPPSKIILEPKLKNYVYKGSKIRCVALDGYPVPDVRWSLVQGPQNSNKLYTISKDGKILYVKLDAPAKSNWIFNCTATNIYPGYQGQVTRKISFTVEDKTDQKTNSSNNSGQCNNDISSIFKNEFKILNEKLDKDLSALRADFAKLRNSYNSGTNKEQLTGGKNIQPQTNSSLEWRFENFYSERFLFTFYTHYTSNPFSIPNKNMKLRLSFNHNIDNKFIILRFVLYVYPVSFNPLKHKHDGFNATIEICNAVNLNLCRSISKGILKDVSNQEYNFYYSDLAVSGILYGDSILIKCYVQ